MSVVPVQVLDVLEESMLKKYNKTRTSLNKSEEAALVLYRKSTQALFANLIDMNLWTQLHGLTEAILET